MNNTDAQNKAIHAGAKTKALKGTKNGTGDFSKVTFTPRNEKERRLFEKTFRSKTG